MPYCSETANRAWFNALCSSVCEVILLYDGCICFAFLLFFPQPGVASGSGMFSGLSIGGVLVGLLWQLPPSFTCTDENCQRLETLGELLRSKSQTEPWLELRCSAYGSTSWRGGQLGSLRMSNVMEW